MHPQTTYQSHDVVKNKHQETVNIKIKVPFVRAEGLALITWASSSVLANQLHRLSVTPAALENETRIKVLELGAGTGLVGLSAAAIWHTEVILTDLAPIVPSLLTNIACNKELLDVCGGSALAGTLDWNAPESLLLGNADESSPNRQQDSLSSEKDKATFILAADTVYWDEHPRMMLKVIRAWLKPGTQSRVLFAYSLRVPYLDCIRELWELLESNGLVAVDEGREEVPEEEHWEDERLIEWCMWKWKDQ